MAKTYAVKEIFYTLQGEGAHAGRAAVFCRFAGCNLWSGREVDRADAVCRFCDTEFVGTDGDGGGKFGDAADLAAACAKVAGAALQVAGYPLLVVLTGGEPMLQVDEAIIAALHEAGFEIAIETNGTLAVPRTIDWICVSPKAGADLVQTSGDELKLVYPQAALMPETLPDLTFTNRYLQPMAGPNGAENTQSAITYCQAHPQWRLSLQTHKIVGIR
jgi:7-carboxy-7-deazaguanine synthase